MLHETAMVLRADSALQSNEGHTLRRKMAIGDERLSLLHESQRLRHKVVEPQLRAFRRRPQTRVVVAPFDLHTLILECH